MSNHRVKVTLPEQSSLAIRRLSAASGESMSGIIAGLLEPNVSALNSLADALENAEVRRSRLAVDACSVFRLAIDHICKEKAKFKESFAASAPRHSMVNKPRKMTVLQALSKGMEPLEMHPYDPLAGSGVWFGSTDGKAVFAVYDE